MSDITADRVPPPPSGPDAPQASAGPLNFWRRLSPSLVPLLAVLTALLATIPFMVITGAQGDIGRGLNIALTAYASFLEGSVGLAANNTLQLDDTGLVLALAEDSELTERQLRTLSSDVTSVVAIGPQNIENYAQTIQRYEGQLTAEEIDAIGERIEDIVEIGPETLIAMQPLLLNMEAISNGDALALARAYAPLDSIDDEQRAEIQQVIQVPDAYSNSDLLAYFQVIDRAGNVVLLRRLLEQLQVLGSLSLEPDAPDAQNFAAIQGLASSVGTGSAEVLQLYEVELRLRSAGITDEESLARQLNLVDSMYRQDVLRDSDVATALSTELPRFLENNFVVYRPGNQPLLINPGDNPASAVYDPFAIAPFAERDYLLGASVEDTAGIQYTTYLNPDGTERVEPDAVYLRIGERVLLFFPGNLERMIVRSIPFIIAGLAVALGFKAGLFNIGAEGQLYAGGILAVFVGFSPIFAGLPGPLHVSLVIVAGIIGGGIWGMIPGALKAFTGAHEVITTIMLNFIAIRLVDWLIRSKDPYILRDPAASVDQTPNVALTARLPVFSQIAPFWFILAGLVVAGLMLWARRDRLRDDWRYVIRPVVWGIIVTLGGLFLSWMTVRGELHLGLLLMIGAVWFTGWFLDRTTLGFEMRTVGTNPDAARYAGMNVKFNIILAMTLSGALAGLAGAIEISSVQFNMKPAFFSGLGFDAIAVALLARTNPRNMIPAGLLWGALVTGAGLMQVRADIANDLVQIIQALIIMFIAADTIIRYIYRVPEATEEERAGSTFSKGWGG